MLSAFCSVRIRAANKNRAPVHVPRWIAPTCSCSLFPLPTVLPLAIIALPRPGCAGVHPPLIHSPLRANPLPAAVSRSHAASPSHFFQFPPRKSRAPPPDAFASFFVRFSRGSPDIPAARSVPPIVPRPAIARVESSASSVRLVSLHLGALPLQPPLHGSTSQLAQGVSCDPSRSTRIAFA